eukprot:Gb_16471 [translate_table: standard]
MQGSARVLQVSRHPDGACSLPLTLCRFRSDVEIVVGLVVCKGERKLQCGGFLCRRRLRLMAWLGPMFPCSCVKLPMAWCFDMVVVSLWVASASASPLALDLGFHPVWLSPNCRQLEVSRGGF